MFGGFGFTGRLDWSLVLLASLLTLVSLLLLALLLNGTFSEFVSLPSGAGGPNIFSWSISGRGGSSSSDSSS